MHVAQFKWLMSLASQNNSYLLCGTTVEELLFFFFQESGHVTLISVVACNAQHLKLVFSSATTTKLLKDLIIDLDCEKWSLYDRWLIIRF